MDIKKITGSGICPKCKKTNLTYGDSETIDENLSYDFTCDDCGAYGKEWYDVTYSETMILGVDKIKN